jgi:anti-sigma B factor antagonist
MELTFETRTERSWTVLMVEGELDLHTSPSLNDRLLELGDAGSTHIAVDMTRVSFMDSSGLGVLVAALKRQREREGDLALVGVTGSPLKVLSITGLDKVMRPVGSLGELPTA